MADKICNYSKVIGVASGILGTNGCADANPDKDRARAALMSCDINRTEHMREELEEAVSALIIAANLVIDTWGFDCEDTHAENMHEEACGILRVIFDYVEELLD